MDETTTKTAETAAGGAGTSTSTSKRQPVQKPRLEIPDSKLAGSASSPRSMHGFPQSPQSPDNTSPATSSSSSSISPVKSFEDWAAPSVASPGSVVRKDMTTSEAEKKSLHFYVGEFVLVRCNQSKWLVGQVRRSSKTGVIVWVGAAQTLVNVPYDLLVSHLVKLDSPSQPASPPSTISTESLEVNRCGELMAPFLCVRPAHLSHRRLYYPLSAVSQGTGMSFSTGLDVGDAGTRSKVVHSSASREIVLAGQEPTSSSTYTPGNVQILKESKAGSHYNDQVAHQPLYVPTSPVAPRSVPGGGALCGFKFQQGVTEDDSCMEKEEEDEEDRLGNDNKCCWITVIENGLDIRKRPTKY